MDIEINNGNTEKFIPHPILDDQDKMMRIIANPVYDKLTIARAANIRKPPSVRKSVRIAEAKGKPMISPITSLNSDETTITTLSTNNNQSESKSHSKRPSLPPISLLPRSSNHRISPRNSKPSVAPRTSFLQPLTTENDKKPITDGTVRYVNSRHGFEIQRYSSSNWLSIDLLARDACGSQEKAFRDMLNQKEQNDLSNRSVYTSEYYRQRFEDLLQSYKDGHLTHDQWARQNYQLNCLKTFYQQAFEREQQDLELEEQNQRQRLAESVFNEWKEAKVEGHNEHRRSQIDTGNNHRTTEIPSVLSNPSSSFPNHKKNRMSIASIVKDQTQELPVIRPIKQSKQPAKLSQPSDMFDQKRWSLNALLKRIVGLAEPLPPSSIPLNCQRSLITNINNDSGFKSIH